MVPRKGLEPLHLTATASKTVMSTIPSPGQIWVWCSRWDLNPHTHRAYASETYVSTIPPPEQSVFVWIYLFCVHVPLSNVAPFHGCSLSGVWLPILRSASFGSHIYHSTTRAGRESIEKRQQKANIWLIKSPCSDTRAFISIWEALSSCLLLP